MRKKKLRLARIPIHYSMMEHFLKGDFRKEKFRVEGLPQKFKIRRINDCIDIGQSNTFAVIIESKDLPEIEEGAVIINIVPKYYEIEK